MRYELFIARRISGGKSGSSLASGPILKIALSGVALGFAVMIIAVAIVTGFKKEIREKVIGFGAHVQISNFDENNSYETKPIDRNQPFLKTFASDPDIAHVQVFATKAGIIKSAEGIEGVVAKGVGTDFNWNFFQEYIIEGTRFKVSDSVHTNEILISSHLAKRLKLKAGGDIVMYFIQNPPRARKFKIAGIYQTGLEEFDKLYLLCDISHIQKLNDWSPGQVGGFEVTLKDFDKLDVVGNRIYDEIGSELNAQTIRERYPQIFDWLGLQNINAIIILTLMIIVAGINMISAILIIILERVSMIGTLKAIGAKNLGVRRIFLTLSSVLIFRGLLIGNIVGIGLCLLQKYTGLVHLDQQSYYISLVPIHLDFVQILLLNVGTFIICTLMMILPTLIITGITPVKSLRFS